MEPQEWCELKVGDKVRHGGETYDVTVALKDTDHNQAVVGFLSQISGDIVRVVTQRISGTSKIIPYGFVAQAEVIAQP